MALAAERIGAGAQQGSGGREDYDDYFDDDENDLTFEQRRRYRRSAGGKKSGVMRWDPERDFEQKRVALLSLLGSSRHEATTRTVLFCNSVAR